MANASTNLFNMKASPEPVGSSVFRAGRPIKEFNTTLSWLANPEGRSSSQSGMAFNAETQRTQRKAQRKQAQVQPSQRHSSLPERRKEEERILLVLLILFLVLVFSALISAVSASLRCRDTSVWQQR